MGEKFYIHYKNIQRTCIVIIATFKLGKKYVKKTVVPLTQPTVLVSVQSGKIVAFCCYTPVPCIFLQLQFGTDRLYGSQSC